MQDFLNSLVCAGCSEKAQPPSQFRREGVFVLKSISCQHLAPLLSSICNVQEWLRAPLVVEAHVAQL